MVDMSWTPTFQRIRLSFGGSLFAVIVAHVIAPAGTANGWPEVLAALVGFGLAYAWQVRHGV